MFTKSADLIRALRKKTFSGIILYEGPSMLDGAPIVVIANRITEASNNEKTGALVQTFIIRSDVDPMSALRSGADASICGDCNHRPAKFGSCYVNVGRSVASVYGAYKRGRYARPGLDYDRRILPALFRGSLVRLGTYGDPAAAPFPIWRAVTVNASAVNGYSHQWRDVRFAAFRLLCMASADNETEAREAASLGWRTFRVKVPTSAKLAGEVTCPASKEAGHKTTCDSCKACGGTSAKARASIVIDAHGPTARRFVGV